MASLFAFLSFGYFADFSVFWIRCVSVRYFHCFWLSFIFLRSKKGIGTRACHQLSRRVITKRLRQIRNAGHFQLKMALVFTVQWFR
ncbi:hypothetical protein FRN31_04425 [Vibrio alginolyticus]|nr:hypothetical protein [Vibrio alginolyticus]